MVCDGCGQRFTGTLATGRSSTYAYYTCGNRQRYGTASCSADRLPADALERALFYQPPALYVNPEDLLEVLLLDEPRRQSRPIAAGTKTSSSPSTASCRRPSRPRKPTSTPSRPATWPQTSADSASRRFKAVWRRSSAVGTK